MKNILIVAPYSYQTPFYETSLELAQLHADTGDQVTVLRCGGDLLACDINSAHSFRTCTLCRTKGRVGQGLVEGVVFRTFKRLSDSDIADMRGLPLDFVDIDHLKQFHWESFDLGYAVAASLIHSIRDPYPDVRKHRDAARRIMWGTFAMYRSVQRFLDESKVDRTYVFNARVGPLRAVFRACQSRGVDCWTHEIGSDIHHYGLFKNAVPLDRDYVVREMGRLWEEAAHDPQREAIAAKFYTDLAGGIEGIGWGSFTKKQGSGQLPDDWNPAKRNIVVFGSSEDEFAGTDDSWKNPVYRDQLDGMSRILDALGQGPRTDFHIYFRMHPNLRGVRNENLQKLCELKAPFLTMIAPEDPCSTYTLLKKANAVVTFGSTVGIEAVFFGKPSILIARAFYESLGGTYNPTSHEDVVRLFLADLVPLDRRAALIYGYYLSRFGVQYKYFEAETTVTGKFRGVSVQPPRPVWWFLRAIRMARLESWVDARWRRYGEWRLLRASTRQA